MRIEYRLGKKGHSPHVFVEDPKLICRNGEDSIPHTFRQPEVRPCVCRFEWRRDRVIAHTIVPWTSLWLFYYEIWLATGEWLGGGEHPEGRPKAPSEDVEPEDDVHA